MLKKFPEFAGNTIKEFTLPEDSSRDKLDYPVLGCENGCKNKGSVINDILRKKPLTVTEFYDILSFDSDIINVFEPNFLSAMCLHLEMTKNKTEVMFDAYKEIKENFYFEVYDPNVFDRIYSEKFLTKFKNFRDNFLRMIFSYNQFLFYLEVGEVVSGIYQDGGYIVKFKDLRSKAKKERYDILIIDETDFYEDMIKGMYKVIIKDWEKVSKHHLYKWYTTLFN
jgi:hypothetical protein